MDTHVLIIFNILFDDIYISRVSTWPKAAATCLRWDGCVGRGRCFQPPITPNQRGFVLLSFSSVTLCECSEWVTDRPKRCRPCCLFASKMSTTAIHCADPRRVCIMKYTDCEDTTEWKMKKTNHKRRWKLETMSASVKTGSAQASAHLCKRPHT